MAQWGPPEFLVPRLSSTNRFGILQADDGVSIACDEAALALRREDGRLNLAWFGSIALPMLDMQRGRRYSMRVRGYIAKTESARGLVLVDVAGGTVAREYPYGRAFDEEFTIETSFLVNQWMARRITASLTLLLERQSDDDEATLVIDDQGGAVTIQLL